MNAWKKEARVKSIQIIDDIDGSSAWPAECTFRARVKCISDNRRHRRKQNPCSESLLSRFASMSDSVAGAAQPCFSKLLMHRDDNGTVLLPCLLLVVSLAAPAH